MSNWLGNVGICGQKVETVCNAHENSGCGDWFVGRWVFADSDDACCFMSYSSQIFVGDVGGLTATSSLLMISAFCVACV